ncbi:hypothetical protein [Propionicicella superfundia]|uniref:hypothetical protein n=1 Tax=Propionicicella superfundia TaxID=348582 RepID=UPI00041F4160|nr:hypothetical protein [Propionicicella superfundia]
MSSPHGLSTRILALIAAVVLAGCSSGALTSPDASGEDSPWWSASPSRPAGCWLPGSELVSCGRLVSVAGQGPDGSTVPLPGVVRLSSSTFSAAGDWLELVTEIGPCHISTTPYRISDGQWIPDLTRRTVATIGCATGADDTPEWVRALFDDEFHVATTDSGRVELASGPSEWIELEWE